MPAPPKKQHYSEDLAAQDEYYRQWRRWYENRQSAVPDQVVTNHNPEYSYADNPPDPPNPYVQDQVDRGPLGIGGSPVGVGDYLDGWHYRDPPLDPETGDPLGPRHEQLPRRAIGWKPNGEPYYGENPWWFHSIEKKGDKDTTDPMPEPIRLLSGTYTYPGHAWWNEIKDQFDQPAVKERPLIVRREVPPGFTGKTDWSHEQRAYALKEMEQRGQFPENITPHWENPADHFQFHFGQNARQAGILHSANNFLWTIERAATQISRTLDEKLFNVEEGDKVGPISTIKRSIIDTPIAGLIAGVEGPSKWIERSVTPVSLTLRDLGEGSPLPEQPKFPGWLPSEVDGLNAVIQVGNPHLWLRAATGPPKNWEKLEDTWENNLQAARMGYTSWAMESRKADYISRLKSGENPDLLAMELEDPTTEMLGRIIFDPLNLIDIFHWRKLQNAERLIRNSSAFLKASGNLGDILMNVDNVTDAASANKMLQFVDGYIDERTLVQGNLLKESTARGLLSYTTDGKRFDLSRRVGMFIGWVGGATKHADGATDVDKFSEIMRSMAYMASDDPDEVREGLMVAMRSIKNSNIATEPLLSRVGIETGIVMRKIASDKNGVFDLNKFSEGLMKAQKLDKAKGPGIYEEVLKFVEERQTRAIDDIFPTVIEQIEKGNIQISPATRFLARFDKKAKSKLYDPVNSILANFYMGMSPGYALKNMVSNTIHIFIDMGPRAFYGAGSFFKPQAWIDNTNALLSHKPKAMLEGFGPKRIVAPESSSMKIDKNNKFYTYFLRVSENMEQLAGARVFGLSVDNTMHTMLTPQRLFDADVIEAFSRAGVSEEHIKRLYGHIDENHFKIDAGISAWKKEMTGKGPIRKVRVLENIFSPDEINRIRKYGYIDNLREAVRADSLEEAIKKIDNVGADWSKHSDQIVGEGTAITPADENVDEMLSLQEAKKNGDLSEQDIDIIGRSKQADLTTTYNYREAVRYQLEIAENQLKRVAKDDKKAILESESAINEAIKPVKEIKAKYPELENGAYQADAANKALKFGNDTRAHSKRLEEMNEGNWSQEWKNIGISDTPPPGLTKQILKDHLWDIHYIQKRKNIWRDAREFFVAVSEKAISELAKVADQVKVDSQLITKARESNILARYYDNIVPIPGKHGFQHVTVMLKAAMGRKDNVSVIRIMASQYGISSISSKGTHYDGHIVAVLKKHGNNAEEIKLLKQLSGKNDLNMAYEAFEKYREIKYPESGKLFESLDQMLGIVPIDTVDNKTGELVIPNIINDLADGKMDIDALRKSPEDLTNIKGMLDEDDQRGLKELFEAKDEELLRLETSQALPKAAVSPPVTELKLPRGLKQSNPKYGLKTIIWESEIDEALFIVAPKKNKAAAHQKFLDFLQNDVGFSKDDLEFLSLKKDPESLKTRIQQWVKDIAGKETGDKIYIPRYWEDEIKKKGGKKFELKATTTVDRRLKPDISSEQFFNDIRDRSRTRPPLVGTMKPPFNPNMGPTPKRMADENLNGLLHFTKDLNDIVRKQWDVLEDFKMTDEVEKVLEIFRPRGKLKVSEAQLVSTNVASEARKFTLHDYPRRRNIDLILAYIFPYHFWYSRTYISWMKRIGRYPGTIAAYAKYKEALSSIHAGAPDWWKNSINTNELLGLDSENPLFFNLESALNPMQAMLGVDFNDPAKRVDAVTRTLDDLGKFGPSTFTPYNGIIAAALLAKGEQDAASRWAGRLIPQTAVVKAVSSLALDKPIELDPFVNLFGGGLTRETFFKGLDPYERRRAGRALGELFDQGLLTEEQVASAAHIQEGPNWDMAVELATDKRAPGKIGSFLLGVGFQARNASDLQVDAMYKDYYRLWAQRPELSSTEFRMAMEQLRIDYPWMDAILLSRRAGPERDISLAYNVLSRIPPGQSGDITEIIGIDKDLISKFYDDKGDMSQWNPTVRDRFMAGIVDLSAMLAIPNDTTRLEWGQARATYTRMLEAGETLFGEDIWDRVDYYYANRMAGTGEQDLSRTILETDPEVADALDWREKAIFDTPALLEYYGGIELIERYYKTLKFDAIEKQFGADIYDIDRVRRDLYREKDYDGWREWLKEHPELETFKTVKETWDTAIDDKLTDLEGKLPEPSGVVIRDDSVNHNIFQERLAADQGQTSELSWPVWQVVMSDPLERALISYFKGGDLAESANFQIEQLAQLVDMSTNQLLETIHRAYFVHITP